MKYNLAFKYRIYPNKEQELLINKTFGCVRFVYNTILYTANKIYEETGKNKIITPASLKSENQFLKEVDSLALSNAQLNVKRSFTNFFQKRAKFPRFKSKKNNVKSYTTNCVNNSIRIEENKYLVLPKLKRVKLKLSKKLSEAYNAVAVEDLNMKGMSQALNFGKSVGDNGWGIFLRMLEYKLMFLGKQFLKIDKWFPSSKTCSRCGNVKEELKLSERSYKCECCGIEIDRDYNASLNIKNIGKEMMEY